VQSFAEQVGLANEIQVDVDVEAADALTEHARVGLYQIIRDAVNQALRRGPPSRISISVVEAGDGSVEAVIADNGTGERRRATLDEIEERARTLGGQLLVEPGQDGGTEVRVVLPPYVAHR
jgi:nitrate/nitrite-specific signal transduction histidine kinase